MVSNSVNAKKHSDSAMRMALNGSDPIRLEPTSAKRAVAVHDRATMMDSISPMNTVVLWLMNGD